MRYGSVTSVLSGRQLFYSRPRMFFGYRLRAFVIGPPIVSKPWRKVVRIVMPSERSFVLGIGSYGER